MAISVTLAAVPVFFATTDGQTRRIAERVAWILCQEGLESATYDLADVARLGIDWTTVRAVVVGATHAGSFPPAAETFVAARAGDLNAVPSLFFSVSLLAGSCHPQDVAQARQSAEDFVASHGWSPLTVASLAGRLAYTRHGLLTRFVMKRMARRTGAPTDTSRDYELTNWSRIDALAQAFAADVRRSRDGVSRAARV